MGDSYRNCMAHLPLLIFWVCLSQTQVAAKLVEIKHRVTNNRQVKFLAVGDWGRKGGFNQSLVAQSMGKIGAKLGIDFVTSTGDNFYNDGLRWANDSSLALSFTNIYSARSLQKPWYAILGNHDYHGNTAAQLSPLLKKRDRRWNCFRSFIVQAGFLHIFLIDTNPFVNKYFLKKPGNFNWKGVLPRDEYLSTLLTVSLYNIHTVFGIPESMKNLIKYYIGFQNSTEDIKSYLENCDWTSPHKKHWSTSDTVELLQSLLPILQANKIRIYINGHHHCLEHINNSGTPIEFLTSGGGSRAWSNTAQYDRYKNNLRFYYDGQGFVSVQLTRTNANVAFYDAFGRILHRFRLKK